MPAATSRPVSCSYSAWLPSTQWTASGCVSSATSRTQASSRVWEVGGLSGTSMASWAGVCVLRSVVVTNLPFSSSVRPWVGPDRRSARACGSR